MILEHVSNLGKYNLPQSVMDYVEQLVNDEIKRPALGEAINQEFANGFRVLSQHYNTKPSSEKRAEAHRKFVDIQIILEGAEIMEYFDLDRCNPNMDCEKNLKSTGETGYSENKDIVFYHDPDRSEISELKVHADFYAIFTPVDAHKPCCNLDPTLSPVKDENGFILSDQSGAIGPEVYKVVIKVPVKYWRH